MALIVLPYIFTVGQVIVASQHNSNFQTIFQDYNGNITDANIAANAAIEYTKLALNNTIKSTDILTTTVLSVSNLPVGTSVGNIVQLVSGTVPQLPPVGGSLITNVQTFTSQNVVTGSRALGTPYKNTTGKTMFLTITGDCGSGNLVFYTDSNSTPVTEIGFLNTGVGGTFPVSFMVLNNNYYQVSAVGGTGQTLNYWVEWY